MRNIILIIFLVLTLFLQCNSKDISKYKITTLDTLISINNNQNTIIKLNDSFEMFFTKGIFKFNNNQSDSIVHLNFRLFSNRTEFILNRLQTLDDSNRILVSAGMFEILVKESIKLQSPGIYVVVSKSQRNALNEYQLFVNNEKKSLSTRWSPVSPKFTSWSRDNQFYFFLELYGRWLSKSHFYNGFPIFIDSVRTSLIRNNILSKTKLDSLTNVFSMHDSIIMKTKYIANKFGYNSIYTLNLLQLGQFNIDKLISNNSINSFTLKNIFYLDGYNRAINTSYYLVSLEENICIQLINKGNKIFRITGDQKEFNLPLENSYILLGIEQSENEATYGYVNIDKTKKRATHSYT